MIDHLFIKLIELAVASLGEKLAQLDLWWQRKFGHSLSGRLGRIEIQTLFQGNTKDQDQI